MNAEIGRKPNKRWAVENGDPFSGKYHRISTCGEYRLAKCMVRDSWVYVLSRGKDRIKVGSKDDCESQIIEFEVE